MEVLPLRRSSPTWGELTKTEQELYAWVIQFRLGWKQVCRQMNLEGRAQYNGVCKSILDKTGINLRGTSARRKKI